MAKKEETKQPEKAVYYQAVGRRKEASARVRLYPVAKEKIKINDKEYAGGQIVVNERPVGNYFPGVVSQKRYLEPLRTTNNLDRFFISIKVVGGGLEGQLEAVIHGISRTLVTIDKDKYRSILKKQGFMTRDPRAKERRKAGFAQKARKRKQSPKR